MILTTLASLARLRLVLVAAVCAVAGSGVATATPVQPGFSESVIVSGLTAPTTVKFAPDGRIFVAEQGGIVKAFDGPGDTTPTIVTDLSTEVFNFSDSGLLGLELDPNFALNPYIYLLYAMDAPPGQTAPVWNDTCPDPPAEFVDGCVNRSRLVRIRVGSDSVQFGPKQVLIDGWCTQFSTHQVGTVRFGPDGALYAGAGDGAGAQLTDYGQRGGSAGSPTPANPCGDPPSPIGTPLSAPTSEGGALRSQDLLTSGDPTVLNGSIIRVDPETGDALPDNPLYGGAVADDDRIIAHGLRNPFRFNFRPGTSELWIGDVGWRATEEIDRIVNPTDFVVENFGWPCFEGNVRQASYDAADLNLCEGLYNGTIPSALRNPYFSYQHASAPDPANCGTGTASTSGVAFYEGGDYPAQYDNALFLADYSRGCIWAMLPGTNGLPDPFNVTTLANNVIGVDLVIGPGGDLYYTDIVAGAVVRLDYAPGNATPIADASAVPTSGILPLEVAFDGSGSSDPDPGETLTYAWDLDADGQFDDGTGATASFTYTVGGQYAATLRVTDPHGATDTDVVTISAGNTAPTASITSPATAWTAGQQITFSGSGTDPEDGGLPASALSWTVVLFHCADNGDCHQHVQETLSGVAGGTITGPDHEFPSYLELRLTATDSAGLKHTTTQRLDPATVDLTFTSSPGGANLVVGSLADTAPFTREVIVGSTNSLAAATPQTLGGVSHNFLSWSGGFPRVHDLIAPANPATYTATFQPATASPDLKAGYAFEEGGGSLVADVSGNGNSGAIDGATRVSSGRFGAALSFDGTDLVTIADSASLDLGNNFTISAWVKPNVTRPFATVLAKHHVLSKRYTLQASAGGSTGTVPRGEIIMDGGARRVAGTSTLPLGAWSHLAVTYDRTAARLYLYVDGFRVRSTSTSDTMSPSGGELTLGGSTIATEPFEGVLDEVRIYNRTLTQAQIRSDMTTPLQGGSPPPPDNTPPTVAITQPTDGATVSGTQVVAATAADNESVTGVQFRLDGAALGAEDTTAPYQVSWNSVTASNGAHTLTAVARDGAGNTTTSAAINVTTENDTIPPTVSLTQPAAGATVSDTQTVAATADDNQSVAGVQFRLDGFALGAEDTTAPYEVSWNTTTATNGAHTLTAVARDGAGNTTTSAGVGVTVENAGGGPAPGLVAAYGFGEGGGDTVTDSSGNGNGGTISGASWSASGRHGSALSFDGADDLVTVADSNSLDLANNFTIEAWVNPSQTRPFSTVLTKLNTTSARYTLHANTGGTAGELPRGVVAMDGGVKRVYGASTLPLSAWTHLAVTYDRSASRLRMWVNGVNVRSITTADTVSPSSGALLIGGTTLASEPFQGLLDEIRIYSRTLTKAEIESDMVTPVP